MYIDPHHSKFVERGIYLPDCFSMYKGYNDFKRKKEKEPRLSREGLEQYIQQLSTILMQPWMSSKRFEMIRKDVDKLVDSLHAYKEYLLHQCDRVKSHEQSPQPVSNEKMPLLLLFLLTTQIYPSTMIWGRNYRICLCMNLFT